MLSFRLMMESDLEQVPTWRCSPDVTRYMVSDPEYNLDNQRRWFEKVNGQSSAKYSIIQMDKEPIGVLNLIDIDQIHRRCSIGYYIGEPKHRSIGFMIPPYVYNYVFNILKMHKIYGEVLSGNTNLLKMHQMHGWREIGVWKEHVYKYGRFHDVHLVELLEPSWAALSSKFGRFVAEFP
jgi:UDP-4-amino-4,6-dideoxy-N-acetyl-beta-L-altrosamine N-acetyltransferase